MKKRFPDSRDPRYRASPRKTRHIRECLARSEERQICSGNKPIACSRCSDNRARSSDGGRALNRLISQSKSIEKETVAKDPGFYQRGFNEKPPPPENFEILSPRKCDFPHCEA